MITATPVKDLNAQTPVDAPITTADKDNIEKDSTHNGISVCSRDKGMVMRRYARFGIDVVPLVTLTLAISFIAVAPFAPAQDASYTEVVYRIREDGRIVSVEEGWKIIKPDADITDEDLGAIAEQIKGESVGLDISECVNITNEGLAHIAGFDRIRALMLPSQISNAGMRHLSGLYGLEALGLNAVQISDAGISRLKWLEELRYLDLSFTLISDEALSTVYYIKKLETLNLSGTRITDAGLERIWSLTNLRNLSLRFCSRITGDGMRHLRPMQALERLDISYTNVCDKGVAYIAELPNLLVLHAARTQISDAGAADLRRMENLRSLNLFDTEISNIALQDMRWMTGLRKLDLSRTRITDEGLPLLRWMVDAETIILRRAPVTEEGMRELETLVPQLYIAE